MTIIKMKNKFVAPLPGLARLALMYVYNKKDMTKEQIDLMHKSIVDWSNKIDLTEEESHRLQQIGKFLKSNEDGQQKELFKKHGINWAKFHKVNDLEELGNEIN